MLIYCVFSCLFFVPPSRYGDYNGGMAMLLSSSLLFLIPGQYIIDQLVVALASDVIQTCCGATKNMSWCGVSRPASLYIVHL